MTQKQKDVLMLILLFLDEEWHSFDVFCEERVEDLDQVETVIDELAKICRN